MARWLLSSHNPRETFGVSCPLSISYMAEYMGQRQMEQAIGALGGGTGHMDLLLPLMSTVAGRPYANIYFFLRNVAPVLPFDPTSIGVPRGLLPGRRPAVTKLLLLPSRLLRSYRRAMALYREALPAYREHLCRSYWQLRDLNPDGLREQDIELPYSLFAPAIVEGIFHYLDALVVVGLLNLAIADVVCRQAPNLLGLLIGQGTSTAQLGERMWALRRRGTRPAAARRDRHGPLPRYPGGGPARAGHRASFARVWPPRFSLCLRV